MTAIEDRVIRLQRYTYLIFLILALGMLTLTSLFSYLLFHSITELLSIVVAAGIFIIGWSARRSIQNGYLLLIGIASLFVAGLDTLHALAYRGMDVFPGYGTDLPTQLWIAARYLQSGSLLIAPLFLHRKVDPRLAVGGFLLAFCLLVGAIFTRRFPVCYREGVGLTPFKIVSEYIIAVGLSAAMGILIRNRREFDPQVLRWLVISLGISILSELAFTSYISVYAPANLIGHLLKVAASYFLFRAIVETGFYQPFSLLLYDLKQSEAALRTAHTELEQRVETRTRELRLSEARFRTIFEASPIGIEVLDLDGRIMTANDTLQAMLHYDGEELAQMNYRAITHTADLHRSDERFQQLATGQMDHYELEKRYLVKSGEPLWAHLAMALVRNDAGKPQFVIGMIENITAQKQTQAELREVQRRLMDSKEAERLHLARELHDGPIQDLTGASFQLQEQRMAAPSKQAEDLASIQQLVIQVSQTLREICGELRPQALAPFGLEKAIRSHIDSVQEEHPELEVQIDLASDGKRIPERARLALFRIYQQALTNVVRHSGANQVSVRFALDEQHIVLEVRDNGRGFQVPDGWIQLVREGHLGLAGISERAEAIGGTLEVRSQPGEGTLIRVSVPWQAIEERVEPIPES